MKELEDKIHEMIFLGVKEFAIVSHTPDSLTENITDIAKEIKDIAIEFARFQERYVEEAFETLIETEMKVNYEGLFQDFLKEKYKP